jgi:hypothetical protein
MQKHKVKTVIKVDHLSQNMVLVGSLAPWISYLCQSGRDKACALKTINSGRIVGSCQVAVVCCRQKRVKSTRATAAAQWYSWR